MSVEERTRELISSGLSPRAANSIASSEASQDEGGGSSSDHSALTGVTANQHHAQAHAADHAEGETDELTPADIGADTSADRDAAIDAAIDALGISAFIETLFPAADAAAARAVLGVAGEELDYVEFTANVSVTGTTSGTAQTCVAGSSVAYDGATPVWIEFFAVNAQCPATAGVQVIFSLFEDATDLGIIGAVRTPASALATSAPVSVKRRLTPSNASHTYTVKAWMSSGTGTISAGAGGTDTNLPGFIRITRA